MARYALRNPWWSLGCLAATRGVSELAGDARQQHWALSEAATAASTAQVTGFSYKEPKTEEQVRAAVRMRMLTCIACIGAAAALLTRRSRLLPCSAGPAAAPCTHACTAGAGACDGAA